MKITLEICRGCFFFFEKWATMELHAGDPMHHIKSFLIAGLVVFLSSCNAVPNVKPIPESDYAPSLVDFHAVSSLQQHQQTYFSVKILSFVKVIDEDLAYYAYDILLAPLTTLPVTTISVNVTPDYSVHEKLEPYFTDKSGLLWKIYPVRPDDISESFKSMKLAELVEEPYGALRFRGYLVDGGKSNYEALGISQEDMTLAMSQLQIIVTTEKTKETLSFELGTAMSVYRIDAVPDSVIQSNSIVSGIVHHSLVVRWGEYLGD
jgi:hypothetical protein